MLPAEIKIWLKRKSRILMYILLLVMPAMAIAQDEEEVVTVDSAAMVEESSYQDEEKKIIPADPELRSVPDTAVSRLKKEEEFAYANDPAYWTKAKKKEEDKPKRQSKGLGDRASDFLSDSTARTIIYIILGVILVLIIYRIVVVNNLFMTPASRKRIEETEEPEREIDDNNLDTKIQQAIRENNYRLAIRFMYLKTLRALNEKGWIRYHAQATNNEYISQVHHYGAGNEFRFLTHVYEYVWYGEFALNEEQFNKVQQNFQHFYNTARL